ncbi:hypothetical protein V1520DRAFT_343712 [Lipomyces starkeyi]|uniref:NADH:flavin oxidoreductase/NADH oxidase N-terminal domain-containing protein n=1 Tax=Lipomyces starkeyi NRRL Y-11557 TaxID=675824 RepID=A0A1E3Q3V2_LIPST|nr:hypothetical protein LIPSTDRAFT_4595 [Lipomyces starkeyi NRRL Y-11557]
MSEPVVVNAAAGVPYYTPAQEPAAGTLLSVPEGTPVPKAFTPVTIRGVTFQNRIFVSPMCQYSYDDGFVTDWTLVAIGSYAVRGASLAIIEATAVAPYSGITGYDAGLWKDEHIAPFKRITDFVHSQGQKVGIQLAHAGRKGSCLAPWSPGNYAHDGPERGYEDKIVAPSLGKFDDDYVEPQELTGSQIEFLIECWKQSAIRAVKAGFDVIEIHGAHGYLINEFLSPKTNKRTDEYGGSFEGRIKFATEVVKAVKAVIPENVLLFFRISASDRLEYKNEGWTVEDTVKFSTVISKLGVDLLDVSSGGNSPDARIEYGPAFQAPFAYPIKKALPNFAVAPVGALHEPEVIEQVLSEGVDAVFVGRPFSHNPSFVLDLAKQYGVKVQWPAQIGYTTAHM